MSNAPNITNPSIVRVGACREAMEGAELSMPPKIQKAFEMILMSSGTEMSIPPNRHNTFIVTFGVVNIASVKSMSAPPNNVIILISPGTVH